MWRGLLPSVVSFSAGFAPAAAALSAAERNSLPDAGPARLQEFAAGRQHARFALTALGHADVDLPRCADGAPRWPEGIVGSIAHTWWHGRVFVIAAVARSGEVRWLGVDVESPEPIPPRAWRSMLTPSELARVRTLEVPKRSSAVKAIWCAKEAAVKACGGAAALQEIEIALDKSSDHFSATLPSQAAAQRRNCTGRVAVAAGWLGAAVVCLGA